MRFGTPLSLTKRLLALLITLAVVLTAGEVALRLLAPFPDYTSETIHSFPDQYHPILGYAGVPNLETWFILPDFKHKIVNNSRGFRDRDRSYDKGDRKRIIVLGDSTAWGWGVEAEERFSDIMEKRLPGWEVINLAQAGYSTDQELLVLETEGVKYRPDIVILLFDRNDVVEGNNARIIDGIQPKPFFVDEGSALVLKNTPVPCDSDYWMKKALLARTYGGPGETPPSFWANLLTSSHLYNWITFRLAHPIWAGSGATNIQPDVSMLEKNMALTKKLLKRIDNLCGEHGARFVITDIPSEYSPLLRGFCRQENILYIDLEPCLKGRLRPVVHRKVGHWTPYGHRVVAAAMIECLREHGFVK
ncbi:MAG: SGNH/GDSL hydrolase family protein [Candidatus Aureabacteria bacterium]|nr:SGNH/GDSL hydrolase family protein [Candidatus Auribacterota bacterium]